MTPAVLSRATGLLDACSANLWQACWQGGLVVLAIWATVRLLPSMPARCQCWLWRLAMLKFMVALLVPTLVDVPLLPAPVVEVGTRVEVRLPSVAAAPSHELDQVHAVPVEMSQSPSLPTILRCLWLLGIGCCLLRLWFAWDSAKRLKRGGRIVADGPILEQLRVQARLLGVRTTPELLEVPGGGSPMLFGMFWPTIVMPAETCQRLSSKEQAMVLGHELAHVRRGDLFWGLMASLIRALFFFHPLAWLCERQLKLAQEIAADELAIAKQKHDPIGYGSLLVSVVGKLDLKMGSRPLVSTISLETAGPVHSLTRKLAAMSRIGRTSRRVVVCSGILLGAVVLLGLVPWRLVAAEARDKAKELPHVHQAQISVGGGETAWFAINSQTALLHTMRHETCGGCCTPKPLLP
jgi:bla regulator protein blaR1